MAFCVQGLLYYDKRIYIKSGNLQGFKFKNCELSSGQGLCSRNHFYLAVKALPSGNSPLSLGIYYCLTIAPRAITCSRFITHQQKLCVSSVLFTKKDKVLPNNLGCLN